MTGHRRVVTVLLGLAILSTVATAAVTSVDSISFDSNSEFFDGQTFVIEYTSSFTTDAIDVFLSSSQLSEAADGETDQSLSLDVAAQNVHARYSIQDTNQRDVHDLTLISQQHDTWADADNWAANHCYDIDEDGANEYFGKEVLAWDGKDVKAYCATQSSKRAAIGDISTPDEIFRTDWQLEASGENPETCTLSNADIGAGRRTSCGDHVVIEWTGNVDTGNAAPVADDELAGHSNSFTNGWRVLSEHSYDNWDTLVRGLSSRYEDWGTGSIAKDTLQSDIDSTTDQAVSPYTQSPLYDATVVDDSLNSGQLRLDLEDVLAWPTFTIYVDGAEYIQVEKPVGQPAIASTNSPVDVPEIGGGTVEFTARNVGDADGSFSGRIRSCSTGFQFDDTQITRTVPAASTTDYQFDVSFTSTGTEQDVSGSCTVEVVNQEGTSATASVSVNGIQENECTPGERFDGVDNGDVVIYRCSEDGLSAEIVERCSDEEEAGTKDGRLTCVEKDIDDPSTGVLDELGNAVDAFAADVSQLVSNPFSDWNRAVNVAAVLVAFVLGFQVTRSALIEPFVDNVSAVFGVAAPLVTFAIGVLAGVLLAWVVYAFIASIWVKLGLLVVGLVAAYLYLQIQALVPG